MMTDKQIEIERLNAEKDTERIEIENLKKVRCQTNKRLKYLTEKDTERSKELHFLITGNAPK